MANIAVLNTNAQLSGKTLTTAEGDWTVSGGWTFSGNQTFTGNVTIGNAVGDTLTITSTITSSLIFTDATYDIGASGATRPRDLFLSRDATIGRNLILGGGATAALLRFLEPSGSGSNYSEFQAQAQAGNITYTLPAADGAASSFLQTNGSGTLSWAAAVARGIPNGRLSLTTALPVTTADVTAATTLYWALYGGNEIALYTGSAWTVATVAQLSIAVPATTDTMYDVFVDYNAGTPVLAVTAWTNDTTRATALTTQNGVLVQTGNLDWRYVGSFRTTGVSGQTEDSFAKRYVWNYYNRVPREMRVLEATNSWSASTTIAQANASTANQLDFVIGVAEVPVTVNVQAICSNDAANESHIEAIGLDSVAAVAAGTVFSQVVSPAASYYTLGSASLRTYPAVGRHYATWLQWGTATMTGYGDDGGTNLQSGIYGTIEG